ncbi:helix-turn-helix domain-containing protein [Tautonia plasticadhaerens]|uniref:Helix-turn-helix domain-containing protein n=1 Tax=Tautonia plasticadhaerens TaxID=2527974 RepID=A0A518HFE5_9BACT|nr:hypothetical protein [Tautonia plasticadhaerens]QDV39567.1 hypothetical protein ElP_75380 [Tautonia plasticadhaerens]
MNDADVLPPFGPLPEDLSSLGLPAGALLLLEKFRFFYCRSRRFCWPSDEELSRRTGLSIHQVRRGLRCLGQAGLIRRQRTTRRLENSRVLRRRFIDLLFVEPGAGAQPDRAPAPNGRVHRRAPARTQEVVVVEGRENFERPDPDRRGRRRPEPTPMTTAAGTRSPALAATALEALEASGEGRYATSVPVRARPAPVSDAVRAAGRPGEAMARAFARLGVEMPTPTPSMPPPSTLEPPQVPTASPASARSRPVLTTEALEALAAGGDPVLVGELARRKAARARREAAGATRPPATTAELLGRIREDPSYVSQAAQALASELGDERSWRGLHAICRRAFEGRVEPEALVYALGKAKGPKVQKPGAIFTLEVGRWRGP